MIWLGLKIFGGAMNSIYLFIFIEFNLFIYLYCGKIIGNIKFDGFKVLYNSRVLWGNHIEITKCHYFTLDQSHQHVNLSLIYSLVIVCGLSLCSGPESSRLPDGESTCSNADLDFYVLVTFSFPSFRTGSILGREDVFLTTYLREMVEWVRGRIEDRGINTDRQRWQKR